MKLCNLYVILLSQYLITYQFYYGRAIQALLNKSKEHMYWAGQSSLFHGSPKYDLEISGYKENDFDNVTMIMYDVCI